MFIGCNVPDERRERQSTSSPQCHCHQPSPPARKVSADEIKAEGRAILIISDILVFFLPPAAVHPSGGLFKLRSVWWVWCPYFLTFIDFFRFLMFSPLKALVFGHSWWHPWHPSICQDWGFELALQISTKRADVHGLVDVEVTWGGPETKIIAPRGWKGWMDQVWVMHSVFCRDLFPPGTALCETWFRIFLFPALWIAKSPSTCCKSLWRLSIVDVDLFQQNKRTQKKVNHRWHDFLCSFLGLCTPLFTPKSRPTPNSNVELSWAPAITEPTRPTALNRHCDTLRSSSHSLQHHLFITQSDGGRHHENGVVTSVATWLKTVLLGSHCTSLHFRWSMKRKCGVLIL